MMWKRAPIVIVLSGLAMAQCRDAHLAHLERGHAALVDGRAQDAIQSYTAAIDMAPDSVVAHFNLGHAYSRQGEFAHAEEAFVAAAARLTGDARARSLYNLGNTLAQQMKLREALSAYQASLRLRPDDEDARYNHALVERWMQEEVRDHRRDRKDEPTMERMTPEDASRSLDALMSGLQPLDRPPARDARPDW